tara:strand:- start:151 stop:468 length:318 start_codon:yes stop_codon:yes gene_type:complete
MVKKFLTLKEAGNFLGIPEDEIAKIVDKRKLPTYKIGGVYTRVRLDDLERYRTKLHKRPQKTREGRRNTTSSWKGLDRIKDFFYFNDFYIYSSIALVVILYSIFR